MPASSMRTSPSNMPMPCSICTTNSPRFHVGEEELRRHRAVCFERARACGLLQPKSSVSVKKWRLAPAVHARQSLRPARRAPGVTDPGRRRFRQLLRAPAAPGAPLAAGRAAAPPGVSQHARVAGIVHLDNFGRDLLGLAAKARARRKAARQRRVGAGALAVEVAIAQDGRLALDQRLAQFVGGEVDCAESRAAARRCAPVRSAAPRPAAPVRATVANRSSGSSTTTSVASAPRWSSRLTGWA